MTPEAAAAAWGATNPRLLSHRENAVYRVELHGKPAALRLHRPGYVSEKGIRSELWWTAALAAQGLRCPRPILSLSGDVLHTQATQCATMMSWVDGAPIGEGGAPLPGNLADQIALYRQMGQHMAQMHQISDGLEVAGNFERLAWDLEGFLGDTPTWGPYWENPALSEADHATILRGRQLARALLAQDATPDIGLIHADLLRENVFHGADGLTFIDFDDSGIGFRLYDITTALTQSLEDAELPHLANALVQGYTDLRPLTQAQLDLLPVHSLLRSLAALGWVIPRYPADHPKMPTYIARATRAIEAIERGQNFFLSGF